MKLSFILSRECIMTGIKGGSRTKEDILSEMVSVLLENTSLAQEDLSVSQLVEALLVRERELSTGVGEGFAFPHARMKNLKCAHMCFAVCPEGVEFASPDRKKVHFLFMTLVPEDNADLLLQARAALMRFLLPIENRAAVLGMETPEKLWNFLDKNGTTISKDIVARDIMCPQIGFLHDGMSISEAAMTLHKYHSDMLPVLDETQSVSGVVTCGDLFEHSLPEFFFTLKTISFARHMDPFEECLGNARSLCVRDLMKTENLPLLRPDSTLTEVLFLMCSKNAHIIYIVENKKLLGVIGRYALVDKILVGME